MRQIMFVLFALTFAFIASPAFAHSSHDQERVRVYQAQPYKKVVVRKVITKKPPIQEIRRYQTHRPAPPRHVHVYRPTVYIPAPHIVIR